MASVNKIILIGNVGKDPEMRYGATGQPQTKFSVATSRSWKKDGEWQEETDWHNVTLWGDRAERAAEQVRKGKQVYIEGRQTNRAYDDKDNPGQKKYFSEVVADVCYVLGRREDNESAGAQGYDANAAPASMPGEFSGAPRAAVVSRRPDDDLDDLPF